MGFFMKHRLNSNNLKACVRSSTDLEDEQQQQQIGRRYEECGRLGKVTVTGLSGDVVVERNPFISTQEIQDQYPGETVPMETFCNRNDSPQQVRAGVDPSPVGATGIPPRDHVTSTNDHHHQYPGETVPMETFCNRNDFPQRVCAHMDPSLAVIPPRDRVMTSTNDHWDFARSVRVRDRSTPRLSRACNPIPGSPSSCRTTYGSYGGIQGRPCTPSSDLCSETIRNTTYTVMSDRPSVSSSFATARDGQRSTTMSLEWDSYNQPLIGAVLRPDNGGATTRRGEGCWVPLSPKEYWV